MSELKPCPFCGEEAHIESYCEHGISTWLIGCERCNADVDSCVYINRQERDDAVAAWNTRA